MKNIGYLFYQPNITLNMYIQLPPQTQDIPRGDWGKFRSQTLFLYFAEKFELTDQLSLFPAILHGILSNPE